MDKIDKDKYGSSLGAKHTAYFLYNNIEPAYNLKTEMYA